MTTNSYPENWDELTYQLKQEAGWTCSKCGRKCIPTGEKTPPDWTVSQRHAFTLQVHHWDRVVSNNHRSNLAVLCSPCHLSYHRNGLGRVPLTQLSLNLGISDEENHE